MSIEDPILPKHIGEVSREDYLKKIRSLEDALNRLNVLEHPREIQRICARIIDLKKILEKSG
jgi:hypothetical protein